MQIDKESLEYTIVLTLYYAVVIRVFFKVLLENKHPLKTQSYLLLLALLPFVGLIIYFYFGVNLRKEKLFSRKKVTDHALIRQWFEYYRNAQLEDQQLLSLTLDEKAKIPRLLFNNESAVMTRNNSIEILRNGEVKYPRLLHDLEAAVNHIHLEYYIFNDDEIGRHFIDLLCYKAQHGVAVRLIFDAVGSSLSRAAQKRMREAGVELYPFMPVHLRKLANRINYRDHRKIVVIDGRVGYLGGMNIAYHYLNKVRIEKFINKRKRRFWRDTHLRIEGESVFSLQFLFILNWYFVSSKLLELNEQLLPAPSSSGSVAMSIMGSSPDSDSESMMEAYFSLITNARTEILITTPYFIPNESILTALFTAAKSGVQVRIVLPARADSFFISMASLSFVPELVAQGIEVYLYTKGIIHSKIIVVDQLVSSVGSANFDYRSFEQNAEVNAFIYNQAIAQTLKQQFEQDIANAVCVDTSWNASRPFINRLVGSVARLVAPLL